MRDLTYAERLAKGEADGLLILHHGRGDDERGLLELSEALDRVHRLHVVLPRAPLSLPRLEGYHWFEVREVGYPEPNTFRVGYEALSSFHDQLWKRTGIPAERTVIGGFSMGAAMSYATGLGAGRPRPAGILAFSGPVPNVEGWAPELASRAGMPVLITHGRADQAVRIEFARRACSLLEDGGLAVTYRESAGGHEVDERAIGEAIHWLAGVW